MAEAQPTWCIFENPLGVLTLEKGLVFENLLLEMESQGYAVQPYIIPACAIDAIHRRDRIWIIAHSINSEYRRGRGQAEKENGIPKIHRSGICTGGISRTSENVANSEQSHHRSKILSKEIEQSQTDRSSSGIGGSNSNAANSSKIRLQGKRNGRYPGSQAGNDERGKITGRNNENACDSTSSRLSESQTAKIIKPIQDAERRYWQKPWPEVATELCRVDVSSAHRLHRTQRLKALGNTIQWEVAIALMQAIKEIELSHEKTNSE